MHSYYNKRVRHVYASAASLLGLQQYYNVRIIVTVHRKTQVVRVYFEFMHTYLGWMNIWLYCYRRDIITAVLFCSQVSIRRNYTRNTINYPIIFTI